MDRGRRRLLCCVAVGLGGCIRDPGRDCPGATYRLRLSPADDAADPISLPPGDLSAAGNAVVEAAIAVPVDAGLDVGVGDCGLDDGVAGRREVAGRERKRVRGVVGGRQPEPVSRPRAVSARVPDAAAPDSPEADQQATTGRRHVPV